VKRETDGCQHKQQMNSSASDVHDDETPKPGRYQQDSEQKQHRTSPRRMRMRPTKAKVVPIGRPQICQVRAFPMLPGSAHWGPPVTFRTPLGQNHKSHGTGLSKVCRSLSSSS
jgi:hypothetical protein